MGSNQVTEIDGYDSTELDENMPSCRAEFIHLSDDVPVFGISNAYVVDDKLIVATKNGVYCYDRNGNLIREISHKGRAANEWVTMGPLIVDRSDGTIRLFDTSSKKVLRYTIDGDYIESITIPDRLFTVYQAEPLDNGGTVFSHGLLNDSGVLYSIEDSNWSTECTFKTPLSTKETCERIGKHPLSVYGDEVKVVFPFDNVIYSLKDNELTPCYVINTDKRILTGNELERIDSFSFNEYVVQMERGCFVGPNNIFENSTHILLSSFDNSFILIDKESGQTDCFSSQAGARLGSATPIGLLNTSSDYFVGVVDVMKAQSVSRNVPDGCDNDVLLKIKDIASSSINSSPYIVLYRY